MRFIKNAVKSWEAALSRPFVTDRSAGMSLIEIILVIALMGTLMTVLITNLTDTSDRGMEDIAYVGMTKLEQKLTAYRLDNHRFPTTDQGLNALISNPSSSRRWRGPYVDKKELEDPWGGTYGYESDGKNFKIISPGPDGQLGNEDDITYPAASEGSES